MTIDPATDLELTRLLSGPPEKVWRCWTEPDLLKQWWTPVPVVTTEAVIEPRPGGRFYTLMRMPDGSEHPNDGSFLEVVPGRKLVFTDLFRAGWRPAPSILFGFSAEVTFEPEGAGTRYRAVARHRTPEDAKKHADMGFHEGWGTVAAQLDTLLGRF